MCISDADCKHIGLYNCNRFLNKNMTKLITNTFEVIDNVLRITYLSLLSVFYTAIFAVDVIWHEIRTKSVYKLNVLMENS